MRSLSFALHAMTLCIPETSRRQLLPSNELVIGSRCTYMLLLQIIHDVLLTASARLFEASGAKPLALNLKLWTNTTNEAFTDVMCQNSTV